MQKHFQIVLVFIAASIACVAMAENLIIGDFSSGDMMGWDEQVFSDQATQYELVQLNDQKVVRAISKNSASSLARKIHVDLLQYPYLNWRWRIEDTLDIKDEKIKSGDDYAARIYVIVSGGLLFWRTKAISYVWTNGSLKGEVWPNAFIGEKAMMLTVRSKEDKTGKWYLEKRNVFEDLKRIYGTEIRYIDAVAIMTDSDNSNGQVTAYYGDINFTSE